MSIQEEDVVRKVAALLAKADSTPYRAEAAALRAKAKELLVRYDVDREAVDGYVADCMRRFAQARSSHMVQRHVRLEVPYCHRKRELLTVVADNNRCRTIQVAEDFRGVLVAVIGFEDDVATTLVLYRLLQLQAARESFAAMAEDTPRPRAFMCSFLAGFNDEVSRRLAELRATTEGPRSDKALTPTLRSRREQVEDEYRRLYPYVELLAVVQATDLAAWRAGVSAGSRADLGTCRVGQQPALAR